MKEYAVDPALVRALPSKLYGVLAQDSIVYPGEHELHVVQLVDGDWWRTGGHWLVRTLIEEPPRGRLAIDLGAGWALDELDTAALLGVAVGITLLTHGGHGPQEGRTR